MKNKVYILILCLMSCLSCSDDNPVYMDELEIREAKSEIDFALNPTAVVKPGGVVVGQLEALISTKQDSLDTKYQDKAGFDIVYYSVPLDGSFNFRLDTTANIRVVLFNRASNQEIFSINPFDKERNVFLGQGEYYFVIENLNQNETNAKVVVPYFFSPDREKLGLGPNDKPKQTEFYKVTDKATLISTTRCEYADMRNLNLYKMTLANTSLRGSNLKYSILKEAFMDGINLSLTNLVNADLTSSFIRQANLDSIPDFSHANFTRANLIGSRFSNAYSRNANFFNAVLINTHLENSTFNKANLFAANINTSFAANADMSESEMSYASLISSTATGANFCSTIRNNWKVDGMVVDENTKCYLQQSLPVTNQQQSK